MASGSLEIWGGKWDSYAKGTHPFPKFKIPPGGSGWTHCRLRAESGSASRLTPIPTSLGLGLQVRWVSIRTRLARLVAFARRRSQSR